jgi:hypothetical protein
MRVVRTTANLTAGVFGALTVLSGIVTVYYYLLYFVAYATTQNLADAMFWTVVTLALLMPAVGIRAILNRGD